MAVKKYTPAKQNVKSFKLTTSLFPVWGPKTKMLGKILVQLLLKNAFLFFLGHLAFVLLQSSFQMLIFFFSPVSQTGNKIIFLRGGQSSTPRSPRIPSLSGNGHSGPAGGCACPSDTPGLKFPQTSRPLSRQQSLDPDPTAHLLLFLRVQVPDERIALVHQGHQLIQQQLLASLLGLSLLPVYTG